MNPHSIHVNDEPDESRVHSRPGWVEATATRSVRIKTAEFLLMAFVFLIPLESVMTTGAFTITRAIGILLVIATLLSPRYFFARMPWVVMWLAAYLAVDAVVSWQQGGDTETAGRVLLTYLQSWIFMWIAGSAFRCPHVAWQTMGWFLSGIVLAAGLSLTGAGQTFIQDAGVERATFGVRDPNENALLAGLALVGCVAVVMRGQRPRRFLILLCLPVLVVNLVQSGSRTGLLATLVGGVMLVVAGFHAVRARWLTLACGLAGLGCLLLVGWNSEGLRLRVDKAAHDRDTSSRYELFAATWEAFCEKPLLGWGEGQVYLEVARRCGKSARDSGEVPHNELLGMLATAGLLGVLPVVIGGGMSFVRAWRARESLCGMLALGFLAVLLAGSQTLTVHYLKAAWLILAFAGTCHSAPLRHRACSQVQTPAANLHARVSPSCLALPS